MQLRSPAGFSRDLTAVGTLLRCCAKPAAEEGAPLYLQISLPPLKRQAAPNAGGRGFPGESAFSGQRAQSGSSKFGPRRPDERNALQSVAVGAHLPTE